MMRRRQTLKMCRDIAPVLAVIACALTWIGLVQPAAAQLFPFFDSGPQRQRGGFGGGLFGGGNDAPYFAPFQEPPRRVIREDFSRAPPPEKRNGMTPERNIVVLGDAMADWLAYGLEDAYSEQADVGVIRRHKTASGLIRYQPKGEPADWPSAVKGVLAPESPAAIVIMLGLNDRIALRETAKADKPGERKPADAAKPAAKPSDARDTDLPDDPNADPGDTPAANAPDKTVRAAGGVAEFREDRWVELYTKKIEEMIAAAKTKGVPVVWVGLPAVRGARATSDMLFLNALYRDVAMKAGITYVDVWDGFVDEAGRFMQQGPDFEGQTRRLRSYDGVYFTRAGARKLAHYAEREINRLFAARSAPIEMPSEPEKQPDVEAKPGGPPPRPLWGPIVPLTVSSAPSDQLMGGPTSKSPPAETQVARVVLKGEVLSPPPGRADDGVWPRRELGREAAPKGGEMPEMASTATDGATAVTPNSASLAAPPAEAQKKRRPAAPSPIQQASPAVAAGGLDFFGLGGFSQPQATAAAQPRQRQAQPAVPQPYPQQQQQVRAPGLFTGGSLGGLFR